MCKLIVSSVAVRRSRLPRGLHAVSDSSVRGCHVDKIISKLRRLTVTQRGVSRASSTTTIPCLFFLVVIRRCVSCTSASFVVLPTDSRRRYRKFVGTAGWCRHQRIDRMSILGRVWIWPIICYIVNTARRISIDKATRLGRWEIRSLSLHAVCRRFTALVR